MHKETEAPNTDDRSKNDHGTIVAGPDAHANERSGKEPTRRGTGSEDSRSRQAKNPQSQEK